MKMVRVSRARRWTAPAVVLLAGVVVLRIWGDTPNETAPGPVTVRLWDTVAPLQARGGLGPREHWRPVATGAPLHLQGDLVVETDALGAAFASRLGKVLVFAKSEPARSRAELVPAELQGKRATLVVAQLAEQPTGAVTVRADFRVAGSKGQSMAFSFTDGRIFRASPQGSTRGVSVLAPMEAALVPSFVGDDLIFESRDYPTAKTLALPSEHVLLGLLKGEGSTLVMTWQEVSASVRLALNGSSAGIQAASVTGARSLSLGVLDAPGIWRREQLEPSLLERDVAISWRPPFPAVWLTQLYEDEVKTTFELRRDKEETWRGGVGSYTYPFWYSSGKAILSLGKKVPPEGEALIYCLERSDDTPASVLTPVDVVRRTLTGDVLAAFLDVEGRPTWYPHREPYVIGGATCGVTDALLKVFGAGQEVERKDYVQGGVEDMYAYLTGMFERNARFYPFSQEMVAYLTAQEKADPKLSPWLREMHATAEEIGATYDNARDTIRDISYAHELGAKTIALTTEQRPDNLQRMTELKQDWTGMGGALERLAAREHTLTRKLYQQAGYGAATRPEAMPVAKEARKRTKQCLENAESYEIWENY